MVLKPEHRIDKPARLKERPFVGRDDLKKIFKEAVKSKIEERKSGNLQPSVLMFHGVPGIGKTELRKKLPEELKSVSMYPVWAALDFRSESYQNMETALFLICSILRIRHQVRFPIFDLAYAVYWKKNHPQIKLNKETYPYWDEASLVVDIVKTAAEELTPVGLMIKGAKAISKSFKAIEKRWTERGIPTLQTLTSMEPYEIEIELPAFLAMDICNFAGSNNSPIVFFFDTYEFLGKKDAWVQRLVRCLPEALFVITGREKLHWIEREKEWENHIIAHKVLDLPEERSREYLTGCGVENKAIQKAILGG
ncbi:MAG: hypothetical protein JSV44_01135, partial [Candidatus Zixiibacteriota bacterium]